MGVPPFSGKGACRVVEPVKRMQRPITHELTNIVTRAWTMPFEGASLPSVRGRTTGTSMPRFQSEEAVKEKRSPMCGSRLWGGADAAPWR
eukprot:CAMPEP_0172741198 /NCGR_PEP_ID=MMETSP1074-20121228/126623_1 /TAXON_ID=2916 /ORGANISM="Ceratium fusus, Strain PA161109" /LENGTH=89 /DNA_ID=CAMNT_0013571459 /DNA_START=150 /DNA_END=416 /DNA_ORIENTATION=+